MNKVRVSQYVVNGTGSYLTQNKIHRKKKKKKGIPRKYNLISVPFAWRG